MAAQRVKPVRIQPRHLAKTQVAQGLGARDILWPFGQPRP
jgi:hypothetical protein